MACGCRPFGGSNRPEGTPMPTAQPSLPLPRRAPARVRFVRCPFRPAETPGPYRLPRPVQDRLTRDLAGFRNRDASYALAVVLGRFWSSPARLAGVFPIDRRALVDRFGLGLTEAQVRGAIATLDAIGFVARAAPAAGSPYKRVASGGLHRRPILFRFGEEFRPLFVAANRRAREDRGARHAGRRSIHPPGAQRPPTAFPEAPRTISPKSRISPERSVIMGQVAKGYREQRRGAPDVPNSALEAAIARLGAAIANDRKR